MSRTSPSHDPPAPPIPDMDVPRSIAMLTKYSPATTTRSSSDGLSRFAFASAHIRWCTGKATTIRSSTLSQA
jgi:hypothetical protein